MIFSGKAQTFNLLNFYFVSWSTGWKLQTSCNSGVLKIRASVNYVRMSKAHYIIFWQTALLNWTGKDTLGGLIVYYSIWKQLWNCFWRLEFVINKNQDMQNRFTGFSKILIHYMSFFQIQKLSQKPNFTWAWCNFVFFVIYIYIYI